MPKKVYTSGIHGTIEFGDVTVTPEGTFDAKGNPTEVTDKQFEELEAFATRMRIPLFFGEEAETPAVADTEVADTPAVDEAPASRKRS